ncbi:hypothetical protein [Actinomadura sp. 9N215]|uniref:hypothetical protein n=1 Tax=Actinomadura sp. 9N215 TaxID=3375150 RepID=UPI003797AABF
MVGGGWAGGRSVLLAVKAVALNLLSVTATFGLLVLAWQHGYPMMCAATIIPMNQLSAAQMDRRQPRLPQTVSASARHPATASDGSVWLGQTVSMPEEDLWTRRSGHVREFAAGRTGIAIIIAGAFVVVTFGLRAGSGRGHRTP